MRGLSSTKNCKSLQLYLQSCNSNLLSNCSAANKKTKLLLLLQFILGDLGDLAVQNNLLAAAALKKTSPPHQTQWRLVALEPEFVAFVALIVALVAAV